MMALNEIVEGLCRGINDSGSPLQRKRADLPLPSREEVGRAVELLRGALFPGYYGESLFSVENARYGVGAALDAVANILNEQVERSFCFFCSL